MVINQSLREKGQKDLSKQRFSILKREVGWQEGVNAKKSSIEHGKMILTFDDIVLKNLGLEGHT